MAGPNVSFGGSTVVITEFSFFLAPFIILAEISVIVLLLMALFILTIFISAGCLWLREVA